MATSTLTNTIQDPAGNVIATSPGTVVNFRLMANGSPTPGFRISDGVNVAPLIVTAASTTGTISQSLENNSNILPTGTYYVAEILCPTSQGGTQEWALLSSSSAASQTFRQALAAVIPSFTPITTVPTSVLTGNNIYTGTNQFNADVYFKSGRPWVDVVAVGADPTGATASDSFIQTAINQVVAAGGGTVYFPYGTYKITASLSVPITARNIDLLGAGAVLQGAVNGDILEISDTTTANNRAEGVWIRGLTINGNGATDGTTYPNQNGINVGAIINLRLDNVRVTNMPNIGIKGLKSAQSGSQFLNEVVFTNVSVRFTGQQCLSWCETGNVGDDLTMIGCMFNNGGQRQISAGGGDAGGVFVSSFVLNWIGMEVSAIQPSSGTGGYKNGAVIRKAAGIVSGIDFENNCNNQSGSADLFLDTDCVGLKVVGTRHSCNTATAAQTGVLVRSNHCSVEDVQHSGGGTHTLTNVVDIQGAIDVYVDGVGDDASGGSPPSGQYVLYDGVTTGNWTDGKGHRITRGPGVSFGGGNIATGSGIGTSTANPSITGDDMAGSGAFTVGTGFNVNQPMVNVSFKNAYQQAPYSVAVTRGNLANSTNSEFVSPIPTTTGFSVYLIAASSGTTYNFNYQVQG